MVRKDEMMETLIVVMADHQHEIVNMDGPDLEEVVILQILARIA